VAPRRELQPESLGDHIDRLYRAAWALCGSPDVAEDLVQETFARVLARPRFLHSEDDVGYLLRVLRNTFLSERRSAARRPRPEHLVEEVELPERRSSLQPEQAAEARLVYAAIATRSVEFREVLVAVDVAGLSYREAASALGMREGTVMSRLFRARRQVARQLEPDQQAVPRSAQRS
jgi:RNA polymerase sigma-70 factor (ECF subfamily)